MSKFDNNQLSIDNKSFYYALAGILILTLSLGLVGLNKGLWADEYSTIRKISYQSIFEMLEELKNDVHPPLYYVLLYYWGRLSTSEEFLRFLSLLLNIGTLGIVISWLKPYSRIASLVAGFYLITTPIMLRYSQELKAYSLLVFATALAFYYASYILNNPEKNIGYIGLTFSLSIAVSTHLVGVMLIPSIIILMTIQTLLYQKNINFIKSTITFIIPGSIFIYFNFFWLEKLQDIKNTWWWMPPVDSYLISSTAKYLFGLSSLYLPLTIVPIVAFIIFALIAISFIFGNWKISFPYLIATIIFWVEIIGYSIINSPIFYYRILLPSLVPLIGFFALQIATIKKTKIKIISIIFVTILGLIYTVNWFANQSSKPIEESRQIAQLVESEWQSNDLILFYSGYHGQTISYYLDNIPSEAQIYIWNPKDVKKIQQEFQDKIINFNQGQAPLNIFLIDFYMGEKPKGYADLFSMINT
jgi:4-amino-4-deoxy-L-arabinose transferase-like glycosyltransferase